MTDSSSDTMHALHLQIRAICIDMDLLCPKLNAPSGPVQIPHGSKMADSRYFLCQQKVFFV